MQREVTIILTAILVALTFIPLALVPFLEIESLPEPTQKEGKETLPRKLISLQSPDHEPQKEPSPNPPTPSPITKLQRSNQTPGTTN